MKNSPDSDPWEDAERAFVSVSTAAALLGVSISRVGRLVRSGRFPGARRGGARGTAWLIPRGAVESFVPRATGCRFPKPLAPKTRPRKKRGGRSPRPPRLDWRPKSAAEICEVGPERYIPAPAAAFLLQVAHAKIRLLCITGKLPGAVRGELVWMIPRASVDALLPGDQ